MTAVAEDEARSIHDLVRTFAAEKVAPRAAEIDQLSEFPWDLVEAMRAQDLFALAFPTDYGGTGTGAAVFLDAIAELGKVCATTALTLALQETGSLPIKLAGSPDQKDRFLPPLASGKWLCAYALTEPGAGSDAGNLKTVASRVEGGYLLNGTKRFISNAGVAGLYTVFACTDRDRSHRGISAFVVEATTPGLEVARLEEKMGLKGQPTGEIVLRDCYVPLENLLGDERSGFENASFASVYSPFWLMPERTITELMVLAMIAHLERASTSGYALKKFADESLGYLWAPSKTQLYTVLQRLEADRLLSARAVRQARRPDKVVYRITRAGRGLVSSWLDRDEEEDDPDRSIFMLKFFFGRQAAPEAMRRQLLAFRNAYAVRLAVYEELDAAKSSLQARDTHTHLALRYGIARARAAVVWADAAARELRALERAQPA